MNEHGAKAVSREVLAGLACIRPCILFSGTTACNLVK